MSLEINWFDIELCGLCIINTHIITCSYKFIYIVQTRRLVNMHSHTYLLQLQSLAQLLTTSLLMGSLTLQLEEVLVFFLSFKTESCSLLGHILQLQVAQPKTKQINVLQVAQQLNNTTEKVHVLQVGVVCSWRS